MRREGVELVSIEQPDEFLDREGGLGRENRRSARTRPRTRPRDHDEHPAESGKARTNS